MNFLGCLAGFFVVAEAKAQGVVHATAEAALFMAGGPWAERMVTAAAPAYVLLKLCDLPSEPARLKAGELAKTLKSSAR